MSKVFVFLLSFFLFSCSTTKRENVVDYSFFYDLNHDLLTEKETRVLQQKIQKGQTCNEDDSHGYCSLLKERTKSKRKHVYHYQKNKIKELNEIPWQDLFLTIRQKPESYWVKEFETLSKSTCPKNLNLAVIYYLDDNLDQEENRVAIDKYYQNMSECSYDSSQELVHLRMSIIYFNLKELDKAKTAISKIENPEDVTRVSFWKGVILEDSNYFDKVIKERPYSLHAVVVADKLKISLWEEFLKRKPIKEERPREAVFVESLIKYNFLDDAYLFINNNLNYFSLENLYYFVKLFDSKNRTDITVKLVIRSYIKDPVNFTQQFLTISHKNKHIEEFTKYKELVDPWLMISLTKQESGFNEKAQSPAKARGLMQLINSTAKSVSKEKAKNIYGVEDNIYLGVNYYHQLSKSLDKDYLSLAAYNAGPSPVKRWVKSYDFVDEISFIDLIPYRETRLYVSNILRNKYFYNSLYPVINLED